MAKRGLPRRGKGEGSLPDVKARYLAAFTDTVRGRDRSVEHCGEPRKRHTQTLK